MVENTKGPTTQAGCRLEGGGQVMEGSGGWGQPSSSCPDPGLHEGLSQKPRLDTPQWNKRNLQEVTSPFCCKAWRQCLA